MHPLTRRGPPHTLNDILTNTSIVRCMHTWHVQPGRYAVTTYITTLSFCQGPVCREKNTTSKRRKETTSFLDYSNPPRRRSGGSPACREFALSVPVCCCQFSVRSFTESSHCEQCKASCESDGSRVVVAPPQHTDQRPNYLPIDQD